MTDLSKIKLGLKGSADLVVGQRHTAPRVGSGRNRAARHQSRIKTDMLAGRGSWTTENVNRHNRKHLRYYQDDAVG
jgi:hypothetical protein